MPSNPPNGEWGGEASSVPIGVTPDGRRRRARSGPLAIRAAVSLSVHFVFLGLIFGTPASGAAVSTQSWYYGMCDASAAVALDNNLFAVANDEDNSIRIYRAREPGLPVRSFDLSLFLGVEGKRPETDLEGAARLGDRIFWVTSHGRNHEGKYRRNRHYFFGTTWNEAEMQLSPVGEPYQDLLQDLLREPRLKRFKLGSASKLAPKLPGALNIEALCGTPDRRLLIGFRNPIPQARALIVPLLNPNDLLAGKSAHFGDPILLDLGGLGIRDLGYWQGRYIIVAGSFDAQGKSRLFEWTGGKAKPTPITHAELKNFNAEAVIVYPDHRWPFQLLSDDGTLEIDGICCKQLPDPTQRRFRSVWVTPSKGWFK